MDVSAAQGAQGAQSRALGQTAEKRLEAYDKGGLAAQDTHTALDEIERLIGAGVYGNTPMDRAAFAAYRLGTSPNDTKGQRTARLQELGNQLILARGSLGGNVSNTDAQVYARAAGNFQQAKNPQEMQESIRSIRTILNKALDTANRTRETYERTGRLPAFEGRPEPAPGSESRAGPGSPSGAGPSRSRQPLAPQAPRRRTTRSQADAIAQAEGVPLATALQRLRDAGIEIVED